MTAQTVTTADVVIFGGGVAGLWTLNRLRQLGYQTVLLESDRLGEGQTRYAQGIIHGGTKYALTGKLTASAKVVGRMPGIWQACLAGKGEIDLQNVKILSAHQYMWSTTSLTSRLSGFFASKVMKSRTLSLSKENRPIVFQHNDFKGQVYQLDEPVLDVATIVHALAEPYRDVIFRCDKHSLSLTKDKANVEVSWQLAGQNYKLHARQIILCAGAGNAALLKQLGMQQPQMQRRPLHMVLLRGMSEPLYAHCLGASTVPRITITSYPDEQGGWVWYLGGQLAEEGVKRSDDEQLCVAKQEMQSLFPWLDLSEYQWATVHIDRAEPYQADGSRPDTAFVEQQENVMTVWPTKLALAPLASEGVVEKLSQAGITPSESRSFILGEFPGYALLPWQETEKWN